MLHMPFHGQRSGLKHRVQYQMTFEPMNSIFCAMDQVVVKDEVASFRRVPSHPALAADLQRVTSNVASPNHHCALRSSIIPKFDHFRVLPSTDLLRVHKHTTLATLFILVYQSIELSIQPSTSTTAATNAPAHSRARPSQKGDITT